MLLALSLLYISTVPGPASSGLFNAEMFFHALATNLTSSSHRQNQFTIRITRWQSQLQVITILPVESIVRGQVIVPERRLS